MKNLGLEPNFVYSNYGYHECIEDLLECIGDNFDNEESSIFNVEFFPVFAYQFWMPNVNYIQKNPGVTLQQITEDMVDNSVWDSDDSIVDILKTLKGEDALTNAINSFNSDGNTEELEKALSVFQKANEHIYYLYPDLKSPKIISVFVDEKNEAQII